MEGVIILNSVECGGFSIMNFFATVILAALLIVFIYLAYCAVDSKQYIIVITSIIFACIMLVSTIYFAINSFEKKYDRCVVSVDNTVDWDVFNEKYEIIGTKNDNYIVIER